jgi:hypothetical protein
VTNEEEQADSTTRSAAERIRKLNERILTAAIERGERSVETYEGLLENLAATLDAVGDRGADWIQELARAQAVGARWLAEAFPGLLEAIGLKGRDLADTTTPQDQEVPNQEVPNQEVPNTLAGADRSLIGDEPRGGAAGEEDLPIANYDELNVHEINRRLAVLSERELSRIDAYEARTKDRKTIRDRIATLRKRATSNGH